MRDSLKTDGGMRDEKQPDRQSQVTLTGRDWGKIIDSSEMAGLCQNYWQNAGSRKTMLDPQTSV